MEVRILGGADSTQAQLNWKWAKPTSLAVHIRGLGQRPHPTTHGAQGIYYLYLSSRQDTLRCSISRPDWSEPELLQLMKIKTITKNTEKIIMFTEMKTKTSVFWSKENQIKSKINRAKLTETVFVLPPTWKWTVQACIFSVWPLIWSEKSEHNFCWMSFP